MIKEKYKKIIISSIALFLIAIMFLLSSYFSREYQLEIQNYIGNGFFGILLFIFVNILAVVIAPFSTLPLIPVATSMWGWFLTGVYSIVAWTIGAQIAFYISRIFGKKLVYKIVSAEKIGEIEKRIPEKNTFWSLVLLRMIVPVDILSYAVGLFSKIKAKTFLATTFIGVIPFAFIFAYIGTLSSRIQIIVFVEIFAAILLMLIYRKNSIKKIILFIVVVSFSTTLFVYKGEIFTFIEGLTLLSQQKPFLVSLILILLKTLSAPLGFPGTPLTLLSGALFGIVAGTVIALIGNTLGAILAFLLSRYIFREYIQNKILPKYPKILKYEKSLEKKAVATVVLLRLIPIFPFNGLNFLLGVTNIPLSKYAIGSFVGMIPGTFLFVYFGESLGSMSLVNVSLALLGIILLTYIGKKYEKQF